MTRIPFPSRRWPRHVQPEVCAICHRPVEHDEIFIAEVEGIRGLPVCIYHGALGTNPSFNDLRASDSLLSDIAGEDVRTEPFGDEAWWEDQSEWRITATGDLRMIHDSRFRATGEGF